MPKPLTKITIEDQDDALLFWKIAQRKRTFVYLKRSLGLAARAAVHSINRLCKTGLVEADATSEERERRIRDIMRAPGEADSRPTHYRLTALGRALVRAQH